MTEPEEGRHQLSTELRTNLQEQAQRVAQKYIQIHQAVIDDNSPIPMSLHPTSLATIVTAIVQQMLQNEKAGTKQVEDALKEVTDTMKSTGKDSP